MEIQERGKVCPKKKIAEPVEILSRKIRQAAIWRQAWVAIATMRSGFSMKKSSRCPPILMDSGRRGRGNGTGQGGWNEGAMRTS